jgi:hypothetical protein
MLGGLSGELLVDYTSVHDNLTILFYVTWGFSFIAIGFFVLLPKPVRCPPPSFVSIIRKEGLSKASNIVIGLYRDSVVLNWSGWWMIGFGAAGQFYRSQIR